MMGNEMINAYHEICGTGCLTPSFLRKNDIWESFSKGNGILKTCYFHYATALQPPLDQKISKNHAPELNIRENS